MFLTKIHDETRREFRQTIRTYTELLLTKHTNCTFISVAGKSAPISVLTKGLAQGCERSELPCASSFSAPKWVQILLTLKYNIPQAVHLSEFKVAKYLDGVRGDIAERSMFFQLEKYYKSTGDDVLIIHSHKFLNKETNNEKDFIVLNLTKGNF